MCDFDDDGFDDQWKSASQDEKGSENGVLSDDAKCDSFTAKDVFLSFGALVWTYEEWLIERACLARKRKHKKN